MVISVIMSTFNNEKEIGSAIASILLQDFEHLELLVVNDASTDNTPQILQRLAQKDERIIPIHNSYNQGRARSRNLALQRATGKYLAIMDADDISMPQRLSRQVQFLEHNPHIGFLGSWAIKINDDAIPTGCLDCSTSDPKIRSQFQHLFMPITHSSTVFNREPLFATNLYDARFARSQDAHLCRRVLEHTYASVLPEYLVLYRSRDMVSAKAVRDNYRWSYLAGRDYLRKAPNVIGYLNLFRYRIQSLLPEGLLRKYSGIYRTYPLPNEAKRNEIAQWIQRLNSFLANS